ncbi:MAG: S1 RNA-binding domain-containing protein [Candidatus ainarchaeum sp.]|jgi:translation initiation factor 2 subunit 1|nr:S1 RNA-binding domain-containing protein [Candidatus ainarchaeum sp.]
MVDFPNINDVVICKVTKITDFGVFAELLEYDNMEGFVHISQISSTWIKNIHNHVKQNQIRAAKVLKVDEEKKHIDISFSRITDADEKRKISEYRLFLRAQSLLGVIAQEIGESQEKIWEEVADPIIEEENSLYKGFLNILKHGGDYYSQIDPKYHKVLFEILDKNITLKDKDILGIMTITSSNSSGFENIKKVLSEVTDKYPDCRILYLGPGKYELKVTSKEFKTSAKKFDLIVDEISKGLKKHASFEVVKKDS